MLQVGQRFADGGPSQELVHLVPAADVPWHTGGDLIGRSRRAVRGIPDRIEPCVVVLAQFRYTPLEIGEMMLMRGQDTRSTSSAPTFATESR